MSGPRIGSLCSGYGGLEMGVQAVYGGTPAWVSDIDKGACKILAHRYPDVPNLGDMTAVDWSSIEPVDILCAGYPCQPFSHAGLRLGEEDARNLWPHVTRAIGRLRPDLVVFENVRGHLTLGFDRVLHDLSLLNYDVQWHVNRAADVGAPHGRARVFIVGRNRGRQLRRRSGGWRGVHRPTGDGRLHAGPAQGEHDRQGTAGVACDARDLRGALGARPQGDRDVPGDLDVAAEWPCGCGTSGQACADAAGEGRRGADRTGVPVDGRLCGSPSERPSALDRRDADPSEGVEGADSGGEPTRPRPAGALPATAVRCATARWLVGAGCGPVRAGGVHGPLPVQRSDGSRPPVRPGVALLPTPRVTQAGYADDGRGGKSLDVEARLLPSPRTSDTNGAGHHGDGGLDLRTAVTLLPSPRATDGTKGGPNQRGSSGDLMLPSAVAQLLPTPAAQEPGGTLADYHSRLKAHDGRDSTFAPLSMVVQLLPTPSVADVMGGRKARSGSRNDEPLLNGIAAAQLWGDYAEAITRWENATGRPAPAPTQPSRKGNPQLAPAFVEWMMGLPAGWVTDVPGITRNEALKACGNGVVPQQAAAALRVMADWQVAA